MKSREYKKRPLSIKLIAFGYVLTPLFFIAQYFHFSNAPFTDSATWESLLSLYKLSFIIVPLFIAFGIYRVHVWGWYLAMGHLFYIIGNNTLAFFIGSRTPPLAILLFSLMTLVILVTFVRKEVRAPYFNPRIRWWESKPRYAITLQAEMVNDHTRIKGETYNISESGMFIVSDAEVSMNKGWFNITLRRDNESPVNCKGDIVWINPSGKELPQGFGVVFKKLDKQGLLTIRHYVKDQKNILKEETRYR